MKKKILVLLIAVMFFVFIGDAKAYKFDNSFKEGDKINVYLNDSDVGEFTVIKDSSSDYSYVYAIYNTHYGSEEYGYDDAKKLLDEVENDWTKVVDVSFVKANQIVDNFNNADVDFTSPSWAITNFNYWTANASYYVENQPEHSSIKKDASNSTKAYVRPVVMVYKEDIKEGINRPTSWNQFVEYLIDFFGDTEGEYITYGDDFINIRAKNDYVNFSFDGSILRLVESESYGVTGLMLEYIYTLLPYNERTKLDESLNESADGLFNIKTDNFTLVFDEENDKFLEFAVNLDYYFGFNKNSASNVGNQVTNDTVENPKTSDINIVIIGLVTLIVLTGVIVGVRRLKKLSK